MKKILSTYSILTLVLLMGITTSSSYAQKNLPKGKWIYQMGMGMMNLKMHAIFTKKTLEYEVVVNGKKQDEKSGKFDIIKVVSDKKKGKLMLKVTGKTKYAVGFYKRLNKNEIIMLPVEPRFGSKADADAFFTNAEAKAAEEVKKMTQMGNSAAGFDIYDMGFIWRTQKKYDKLNKLPTMGDLDKDAVLKLLDSMIETYKKPKNKAIMKNPMAMMRIMEGVFISNGYNPFTSMGKMMQIQSKYSEDPDVKKKAQELQETQKGKQD